MKKKRLISIIVFIVGFVALIVGLVFLIMRLNQDAALGDADYLVSVGSFSREDEPEVVWTFTEIGKGRLTTNNYLNEYDFIWALEDGKIKIETDWLYALNDEYDYQIEGKNLVLVREDSSEIKFSPASSVNPEIGEDDELVVGD